MSKIAMMFKIVSLLQTRFMISAGELAQMLETSPRNIKAYIESLRMADVPIEGMSGKNGGYFLDRVYNLPPSKLDEAEYSALLLAEEFLNKDNGFNCENEIKSAFAKIKAAQGEIGCGRFRIDRQRQYYRQQRKSGHHTKDQGFSFYHPASYTAQESYTHRISKPH